MKVGVSLSVFSLKKYFILFEMRKQRKIRKEDIGDPSNFVHVQHVGFGGKKSSLLNLPGQKSFDLGEEEEEKGEKGQGEVKVERRSRGSRSSLIPRHHRSTTTCIFPENGGSGSGLQNHLSMQDGPGMDKGLGERNLKPRFGSMLNLSFLPLGLGKSSKSKSPSVEKTKRMSLLNLTTAGLFQGKQEEGSKEKVMMTGFTRRRSFSNTREKKDEVVKKPPRKNIPAEAIPVSIPVVPVPKAGTSRAPLAKLGRSKSTMSELPKRPKLRLKIAPPSAPPPPIPVPRTGEPLPSPPPSPLPSPPKTPTSAPPIPPPPISIEEELALSKQLVKRRVQNTPPRSRIIPMAMSPSIEDSTESLDRFLTPNGGSSPTITVEGTAFPLLSPTLPPSTSPFFSRHPGTPPCWPLQPSWPVPLLKKEPTIPELPSPVKEEMDVETESEYEPVAEIVDSFLNSRTVNESNLDQLKTLLSTSSRSNLPQLCQKLLNSTQSIPLPQDADEVEKALKIYEQIIHSTLNLYLHLKQGQGTFQEIASILDENQEATE